jgi:phage terminase large subunit-like protein
LSASLAAGTIPRDLAALDDAEVSFLASDWQVWARDDQLPPIALPSGARWRTWLILGGRGAGKTRAGAEWIRAVATDPVSGGEARIALVGETLSEVRRVMIEGVSGLVAIHAPDERPRFEPSKRRLVWSSGAIAEMFSAEDAEGLRGPQFSAAWCDEVAKWREPERVWDMLQFGLRLGAWPQVVATTTPRPVPFLKKLIEDETTAVTRASTHDNAANLAPSFIAEMTRRYAGSALGRQELMGELIDERAGSLWRRDWIETARVTRTPDLRTIVVAVDPPVTATSTSDACGIVVAGVGDDNRAYVLADRTLQGREPAAWARAAIAAYHDHRADRIVAETNQGGDLVIMVLKQIDARVPVRTVRATRGKWVRAEPVAALYAEGRVAHVGSHEALEDQMCAFGIDGLVAGKSPDRVDALVWALTDLMLTEPGEPQIRRL